jgi:hypothetical protein
MLSLEWGVRRLFKLMCSCICGFVVDTGTILRTSVLFGGEGTLKSGQLFVALLSIIACLMIQGKAGAAAELTLQMTAEKVGDELFVEVHRTNTEFGLGGFAVK